MKGQVMEACLVTKASDLVVFRLTFAESNFMERQKNACASSLSFFLINIVVFFGSVVVPLLNFMIEKFEVSTLKFQ